MSASAFASGDPAPEATRCASAKDERTACEKKEIGRESALHALLVARIRYAVMESGLDAGLVCAAGRAAFMRITAFSMARGGSNA